ENHNLGRLLSWERVGVTCNGIPVGIIQDVVEITEWVDLVIIIAHAVDNHTADQRLQVVQAANRRRDILQYLYAAHIIFEIERATALVNDGEIGKQVLVGQRWRHIIKNARVLAKVFGKPRDQMIEKKIASFIVSVSIFSYLSPARYRSVVDLPDDDFDLLTGSKVFIAVCRTRARGCVDACVFFSLAVVG